MTVTINGTNGVTTPEVVLDNSAADGAQVVLKSSGYSDWNLDNYSGRLRAYYGSTEYWTVNASGNVGVGTSSPAEKLEVAGMIRLSTNPSNPSTNDASIYNASGIGPTISGNAISFRTQLAERARIDSSGNLLVGTTSAQALTTIYRTTSGDGCTVQNTNNGSHANFVSRRAGTSGAAVYFDCAGNQAGTITHPSTTSTNYGSGSDYRLKDNIQPLDNALSVVVQLKPSKWNWKTDGSEDTGFIAHELQEFFPSAVTGEKDAVDENGKPVYQCIDTSFLVATLTAAIQEQQALIASQSEIITALTARVTALEGA